MEQTAHDDGLPRLTQIECVERGRVLREAGWPPALIDLNFLGENEDHDLVVRVQLKDGSIFRASIAEHLPDSPAWIRLWLAVDGSDEDELWWYGDDCSKGLEVRLAEIQAVHKL